MKLIFLGSGAAFTVGADNFQSNIIIENPEGKRLLFDCGGDIRFSLFELGYSYKDLDAVYVSHLHADHVGGMEWFALKHKFDPTSKTKPHLFVSDQIVDDMWNKVLAGGLSTLPTSPITLETYFEVHPVGKKGYFEWEGVKMELIPALHCMNGKELMPNYGLMMHLPERKVWITSDLKFHPKEIMKYYEEADVIFHDCETMDERSNVHSHYTELVTLPKEIKKKMWLYHINPGPHPNAVKDGFCGFVHKGQTFIV